MKVFLHGLGQKPSAWRAVLEALGDEPALCPDLTDVMAGREMAYAPLYRALCDTLDAQGEQMELCGLSLGAVLAMHYAMERPQRVRRLALIAPQVKPPRAALALQGAVFRLMPERAFVQTGLGKRDCIRLCGTMARLDFTDRLREIGCKTLVICGEHDRVNRKAARLAAAGIRDAELHWIPGAGHEVNLDAPQALAELLNARWGETIIGGK